MDIITKINAYLENQMPVYLKYFNEMVAINSYTENRAGVNRLGQYTADLFAKIGFSAKFYDSSSQQYGRHLVLKKNENSKIAIGCVSHLDTVFPPEEELQNDFCWKIQNDKIYGPGTNDIKGGTIILFMMMDALKACVNDIYKSINWTILLNASEETMSDDFADLCLKKLSDDTKACLVFEAGKVTNEKVNIVTARKGRITFTVEVEGKGGHAGSDHKRGANAIVQLCEVLSAIAEITDYDKGITCNIGTINGGITINRIPEKAGASGEIRAFLPDSLDEIKQYLENLHENINKYKKIISFDGNYSCNVVVQVDRIIPSWPMNEKSAAVLTYWQKAAQQMGLSIEEEHRGGLSDGNYFWNMFPTLDGLGVDGDNAHCSEQSKDLTKEQEYAVMSSMIPKTILNSLAIINMVEEKSD